MTGYLPWGSGLLTPMEWQRLRMRVGLEFRGFVHTLSMGMNCGIDGANAILGPTCSATTVYGTSTRKVPGDLGSTNHF